MPYLQGGSLLSEDVLLNQYDPLRSTEQNGTHHVTHDRKFLNHAQQLITIVFVTSPSGAELNAQTEETQETALTLACCGGFLEVADFLIRAGGDIELGCSTPLMEAAQEGHLDLVKFLLDHSKCIESLIYIVISICTLKK